MIELLQCSCPNTYQDNVYGKGYRVHNYAKKSDSWRCSVCGLVRRGSTKKVQTEPQVDKKKAVVKKDEKESSIKTSSKKERPVSKKTSTNK